MRRNSRLNKNGHPWLIYAGIQRNLDLKTYLGKRDDSEDGSADRQIGLTLEFVRISCLRSRSMLNAYYTTEDWQLHQINHHWLRVMLIWSLKLKGNLGFTQKAWTWELDSDFPIRWLATYARYLWNSINMHHCPLRVLHRGPVANSIRSSSHLISRLTVRFSDDGKT